MRDIARRKGVAAAAALILALGLGWAAAATAADIDVQPLLRQRSIISLEACEGIVIGGLDGGGTVLWPAAAPDAVSAWTADDGLSGNYVTCLAWTGRYLWAGTLGAGLTRVADPAGAPEFRQYAGNLAGLDITALAGGILGDAERVWYAAAGEGVGVITNGIAGATYTSESDGLVSNDIDAIAVTPEAVWFGSAVGVSRLAGNVITTVNTGLTNIHINDMAVSPDSVLTAAGEGGVYTWSPDTGAWTRLGTPGYGVDRLTWRDGVLWVMGGGASGTEVASWDGLRFSSQLAPYGSAAAIVGDEDLWLGGRLRLADMGTSSGVAWYARLDAAGTGFEIRRLENTPVAGNITGVTFGADGTAWIGSHIAQGFAGLKDGAWTNVWELASADNDSNGMINHSGNILAMATDAQGRIWATQYGSGGLLRHDPATGRTDQVLTGNSGLAGRGVVRLEAHPDGPLIVMHDWQDATKVEVLIDTDLWRNPDNWVALPTGSGGLGDGPSVWSAYVERNDVIWFAVESTGLVRWDVNGDDAGPDDPLTWTDPSDDRWDDPVAAFPGVSLDPKLAKGLDAGPAGTIWCGGDGLVRFRYDADYRYLTVEDYLLVKQSPLVEGLLGGGVGDIATDSAGDLWVASLNGLNRVRLVQGEPVVDAWLDLMNYVAGADYSTLYSPSVISGLPGFLYRRVIADPGSRRVLVASDRGAALVTPADAAGGAHPDPLALAYLSPMPWDPDTHGDLVLGGLDATVDEPAAVTVYTVEGQVVYNDPYVAAGTGFWAGRNAGGNVVATGLYVVRITWRGATTVRTLAVVR
jgi:hypothetical protein